VEPFIARVTVRLLPEIPVTRICNVPIRTVWPISSWVPSSTATVVLVVPMEAPLRSVPLPSEYWPYPHSVHRMQTRRPYFLHREPSVQCRDRPNAVWRRSCWTETSNL